MYKALSVVCAAVFVCSCSFIQKTPIVHEPEFEIIPSSLNNKEFYALYSKRLGITFDGTENRLLIQAIDQWIYTPYKWGGCSAKGIDCSCLVKLIYKAVYGIELSRTSMAMFENDITPIKQKELREGDLISFRINSSKISHVGLYVKNSKFLHASEAKGVRINDLKENYYRARFHAAGRVKKLEGNVWALCEDNSRKNPHSKIELGDLFVFASMDKAHDKYRASVSEAKILLAKNF